MVPGSHLTSGGLGAMGYALPAGLGAAIGRPERPVWVVTGDGGFQMTLQELATVVQEDVPLRIAVIDNGYLGMVRQWQELFYDRSYVATNYTANPDFVKLADAFGMLGLRVTDKTQVRSAIEKAMEYDGPALIDFVVEEEENVFPMIPAGQTIHEMIEEPVTKEVKQ